MHAHSCFLLYILHITSYWATVAGYTVCYRNQTKHLAECIRRVVINQIVGTPLLLPLLLWYTPTPPPVTYSYTATAMCLLCSVLLTDVLFWHLHYAMHRFSWLYVLHNSHHAKWNHPVAASALHAGLFEHVLVNSTSPVIAAMLSGATESFMMVWIVAISVNVVVSHAQIDGQHVLHHKRRDCNFGVGFMLMDRLYGTFRC